jgi:hypothetical protein
MKTAVMGASGRTGRIVLRDALARGHEVIAVRPHRRSLKARRLLRPARASARPSAGAAKLAVISAVQPDRARDVDWISPRPPRLIDKPPKGMYRIASACDDGTSLWAKGERMRLIVGLAGGPRPAQPKPLHPHAGSCAATSGSEARSGSNASCARRAARSSLRQSTNGGQDTPGFSKETAPNVGEFGPVTDRLREIDGYTVTIVPVAADVEGRRSSKASRTTCASAPIGATSSKAPPRSRSPTASRRSAQATRATSRPDTRRRTAPTQSWSCSAQPANCARPRKPCSATWQAG